MDELEPKDMWVQMIDLIGLNGYDKMHGIHWREGVRGPMDVEGGLNLTNIYYMNAQTYNKNIHRKVTLFA